MEKYFPDILDHDEAAAPGPGFVPLPGMVGYSATVWDLRPTYPPSITEHGAPGGSDLPPQNYGTWCRESAELQRESGEISKLVSPPRRVCTVAVGEVGCRAGSAWRTN